MYHLTDDYAQSNDKQGTKWYTPLQLPSFLDTNSIERKMLEGLAT